MAAQHEQVADAIRSVSDEIIMPRFQLLSPNDVMEKGPGDVVTIADQLAEAALTNHLLDIEPGSLVVGEEAVAADPAVLEQAERDGVVWIIDPIDGTRSYSLGRQRFAVMVAKLVDGVTQSAWIWQPVTRRMFSVERGRGAYRDDERITKPHKPDRDLHHLVGDVRTTFFVDQRRLALIDRLAAAPHVRVDRGGACGFVYPELATGDLDFAVFGRQYPWDHAAGVLLLSEAGGCALDLAGDPYIPTHTTWGLLSVSHHEMWQPIHRELFG